MFYILQLSRIDHDWASICSNQKHNSCNSTKLEQNNMRAHTLTQWYTDSDTEYRCGETAETQATFSNLTQHWVNLKVVLVCTVLWKAKRCHSNRTENMTHVADHRCGEMVTLVSYLLTQHCNCRALRNAIANKQTKCWFTPPSPSLHFRKRGSWNTFNITSWKSIHLDSG